MKLALSSSVLLVASLLAGCPGNSSMGDTGGPDMDGGGEVDGGGVLPEDGGGPGDDGGGGGVDGGGGTEDGGVITEDAGPAPTDGGTPMADAGGGTGCSTNGDCSRAQYCATEPGMCDTSGVCTARPRICPDLFAPVCGCDGTDYNNPCEAASAGVNVGTTGMCPVTTCDLRPRAGCCYASTTCGRGATCIGATCAAGGEGVCEPLAEPGTCWQDSDCGLGGVCTGARICPCGARCLLPDAPGACALPG